MADALLAAGLRETDRLREVLGERHRWHAVRGHLHELDGDLPAASAASWRRAAATDRQASTRVRKFCGFSRRPIRA